MTFSYVDHPVIVNDIIPVVQRAYSELGIKIKLEMHPSSRNIKAVESGIVDGDIAFSDLILKGHETLIKIEPSLVTSVVVLLCIRDVQCNQDVLFDNNVIVSTDTIYEALLSFYPQSLSNAFYSINNLSIIPELLVKERFKYGIYVSSESQVISPEIQHLTVLELFKSQTYHTIHQKYEFMKDDVSAALKRSMDKVNK
jgi:hypothetical protein